MDPFAPRTAVPARALAALVADWRGPGAAAIPALAAALRTAILDGRVEAGARLPSERDLADALGVGRTTVRRAYDALGADGLLVRRRGSGASAALPADGIEAALPVRGRHAPDVVDLAFAAPRAAAEGVREALVAAAGALDLDGAGYHPAGLPVLRAAIAARCAAGGAPTTPAQVCVTSGAQQAIQLVVRAALAPGDAVLVERPTYPLLLEALAARRARVETIDVEDGWDANALVAAIRRHRPRVVALVPDAHVPTGRTMPEAARRAVVDAALRAGALVLADETTRDLAAEPGTSVAALAPDAAVVVGSVSKTAWGGLRVGWVRGPRALVDRVAQVRSTLDVAGPPLEQAAAALLLPGLDAIARARRDDLAARRAGLAALLADALPGWRWDDGVDGASLWVDLGAPRSEALARAAPAHGVRVMAASRFAAGGGLAHRLRVPAVAEAEVLAEGVERLAGAWREVGGYARTSERGEVNHGGSDPF